MITFRHTNKINNKVYLEDDGTLDTVINVNNKSYRFDCEYASQYRTKEGIMTKKGLITLAKNALDSEF